MPLAGNLISLRALSPGNGRSRTLCEKSGLEPLGFAKGVNGVSAQEVDGRLRSHPGVSARRCGRAPPNRLALPFLALRIGTSKVGAAGRLPAATAEGKSGRAPEPRVHTLMGQPRVHCSDG